jgi:hypothetical protein
MSRRAPNTAVLAALVVTAPAWADHSGGLRTEGMNPVVAALVWAAAAFLVAMAIVAIVTVLARHRPSARRDRS